MKIRYCPFCNDRMVIVETILRQGTVLRRGEIEYRVHCTGCGADGPPSRTHEGAVKYWNIGFIREAQVCQPQPKE